MAEANGDTATVVVVPAFVGVDALAPEQNPMPARSPPTRVTTGLARTRPRCTREHYRPLPSRRRSGAGASPTTSPS